MDTAIREISTADLRKVVGKQEVKVVDVRPVDAYNGWTLRDEPRGGHIKAAKSLPAKWADYLDWIEIVRSKGISPDQHVVIYGYATEKAERVARLFMRAGYANLNIYPHFLEEWSPNPALPMERLERYKHLVPPEWLCTLLSGDIPGEYDGRNHVVCHAHYRNNADYEAGHIPGAIALDTRDLESSDTWNRRAPAELKQALENHGIAFDTTVILYGRFSFPSNDDPFPGSSAGHLGAIRCAVIMMYAGVKDVRVLNGGIQSWGDAGYNLSGDEVTPQPAEDFGAEVPGRPELFIDLPEARELLQSDDGELVSVRSWKEFIGEVSGYNYIERKGRIPGAIFANCGSDAYHMENYRHLDHTTREYQEIVKMWREAEISPEKRLAFYCGTGWRGSEAFYNAWLMGRPRISVYDGGWFEWSSDTDNLIESGLPEQTN